MKKAFTLVETLLALLILSFGMTVLLTGAARSMASIRMSKDYQDAQWTFGQAEVLFPLLVTGDPMELEVPPHDFDNGHVFERRIEETEDEGLFIVHASVTWSLRNRQGREETVRYLLVREEIE